MQHEVLLEKIVQNLSFDVKTIENDSAVQIIGPSGRTPIKVKVKVRKKDKVAVHQGVISIPEKHPSGTATNKLRFVSSDQTITSFDVFLEADPKLPMKKHRNKFLDLLRPGICLGDRSDENDHYLPRQSQNSIGNVTSKSDGVLRSNLALSKKDYIELSKALSKKNPHFLGKCKPGGCLDPPFSEDKYSYTPSKKPSKTSTSLYLDDNFCTPKKLSDHKTYSSKQTFPGPESTTNVELPSQEHLTAIPIQKLYQAESAITSLSITYSNSIITYPPPLTPSEIRLNNGKNTHQRGSTDSKTKRSYELPHTYFMPPREIIGQFDSKDSSRNKFYPKEENDTTREKFILKGASDIDQISTENMGLGVPGIAIAIATSNQVSKNIAPENVDIKTAPVVDDIGIKRGLEEYDGIPEDDKSTNKHENIKEITPEPTSLMSMQHLKSRGESPKLGSFARKSIEIDLKPSVRSSLAETNLIIHKMSSSFLVHTDKEVLYESVDILPLTLEENHNNKKPSTQISFPETNTMKLQKSIDMKDSGGFNSPLQQTFAESSKSEDESNELQKDRQSKLDHNIPHPTTEMLDTEYFNVLEETNNLEINSHKDPSTLINGIQSEPMTKEKSVAKIIYNANDNVIVNVASPITKIEKEIASEKKEQQIDHPSKINVIENHSETYSKQEDMHYTVNNLSENNNVFPHLDHRQPENKIESAPDKIDKTKLIQEESTKYFADTRGKENAEDPISSRSSKLSQEPLLYSKIDNPNGSREYFFKTTASTTVSSTSKLGDDLIKGHMTETEKHDQIVTKKFEADDLKENTSHIIPEYGETLKELKRKSDGQTIEDANILESERDLHPENVDEKNSEHHDKLSRSSEKSKEYIKEYNRLSPELEKKDQLENIEQDLKFTVSIKERKKTSQVDEVATLYPQHILDNKESQFVDPLNKAAETKLHSSIEVFKQQSSTQLFGDEIKLSQVVDKIEVSSNIQRKTPTATKITSYILPEIDPMQGKVDKLGISSLDTNTQLNAFIDNTEQLNDDNKLESLKPINKSLLENELEKTDTIPSSMILMKPQDISNIIGIRDKSNDPSLSHKPSNEENRYHLESVDGRQPHKTNIVKSEVIKKEYETISPQSSRPKYDDNALFINTAKTKNEESNLKFFKTSTMFDVLAIPDPKKLKGEIATLKNNTVRYTPSITAWPNRSKKDSITVDLAFHSYVNENNESVLQTFNSHTEPQRFTDDRIIIIKTDIDSSNNEIKIPIDLESNIIVQLKKSNKTDHHSEQHNVKAADYWYTDKAEGKNTAFELSTEDVNSKTTTNIQSIYEKELLPLQNAIKELKHEIDSLTIHNLMLKDNLITRKSKPIRLTNVKKCVCLKRI